jgi:UPF0042 nucleotide-binding protein
VKEFLESDSRCLRFYETLSSFIEAMLQEFDASDRSYMTIAVGCTGGQHRSVYLANRLHQDLVQRYPSVQIRHRDLSRADLT